MKTYKLILHFQERTFIFLTTNYKETIIASNIKGVIKTELTVL